MSRRVAKPPAPPSTEPVYEDDDDATTSPVPTDDDEEGIEEEDGLDSPVDKRLSQQRARRNDTFVSEQPSSTTQAPPRRPPARPKAARNGSIVRNGPTSRNNVAGTGNKKRKGGLFGRLKSMRKKNVEDEDSDFADEVVSESEVTTEMAPPKKPSQPSYPSPKDTLGISAFQRSRGSTSPSAITGAHTNDDGTETVLSPLRAVGTVDPSASNGKGAMQVRESEAAAKLPDLVEKAKPRKSNPKRYSIAQSVEASLVGPSWSTVDREADDDEEEEGDDDDDATEEREEEDDESEEDSYSPSYWLQDDAGPPMVEGSVTSDWRRTRRAYEEEYEVETTTTQAENTAGKRLATVGGKGKKKQKKRTESFYATEVSGIVGNRRSRRPNAAEDDDDDEAAHSVVNRLLAKLEADGVEDDDHVNLSAVPILAPIRSAGVTSQQPSRKISGDDRKKGGTQSTGLFVPAIAPSVVYGGGDETLIMPDDSVSIRAARRFAQEQLNGDARGPSRRPTSNKPKSAQDLAAAFAALEPPFIDDDEVEGVEADKAEEVLTQYDEDDEDDDRARDGPGDDVDYDDDRFTESPTSPRDVKRSRGQHSRQHSRQYSQDTSLDSSQDTRTGKRMSNIRRKAVRSSTELGHETWLVESALTPEQLHYLVKSMVAVELDWELQRAFVFDPTRSPVRSSYQRMRPSKSREYAIFRRREVSREDLPQLPLVRFLYDTAFTMLPIFGGGQTHYERRRAHADAFWKRSVLPLLRIVQSRSLSKRVDRYGEGDRGPFSAQSTLDVLSRCLRQAAVRFITATIKIGDADVKEGWPWPSANMMRLPAFTPYRVPLEKQSRGAYEVDIISTRPAGAQTAYFLVVKRNTGQPQHYILRTEAQFREFANAISRALPKACIKQPPALEMAHMPAQFRELIRTVDQATVSGSTPDLPMPVANELQKLAGGSSADLGKRTSKGDLRSAAAPAAQEDPNKPPPKLGRLAALKAELRREIQQELNRGKGGANADNVNHSRSNNNGAEKYSNEGGHLNDNLDRRERPSMSESRPSFAMSSSFGAAGYDNSSPATDSRATLVDPPSYSNSQKNSFVGGLFGGALGKRKEDTTNYEARRLQLRDWLRDALSARGVGHDPETQTFLNKAPLTDRDLKKATKEGMAANRRADEQSSRQRQDVAAQAGEEVLDLRDMLEEMWEECKFSDGFLQAKKVFAEADSFAALPEDYQGIVSYLHLKTARLLDGIFITGSHSAANFRRAKAGFKSIPWKLLTVVMNEPTGLMVKDLKRILTHPSFISRMTSAVMDDDPRRVEEGLAELKRRLPSDYLRKLRRFVEATPDDLKRLIRDSAEKAGVPLVSAILRGNDAPVLQGRHLQVIVRATKTYQSLMDQEPTMLDIEMSARRNREIGLIRDLQHALRLYSARRDGQHLRDIIRSSAFRSSFAMLAQPLVDYIAKLHHRSQPLKEAVRTLRVRVECLLELIEALRSRVQDPARNIDALTTFLDSHAHDTVSILSALTPLFPWFHVLAHTVGEGSDDLAREWSLPPGMSGSLYPLEGAALNNLKNIAESAWLKRIRLMEVCSRWIAGDVEADQDIQVLGGEGEQSRTRQILPEEPLQQTLDRRSFKPFLPGFREALATVLDSR